MYGGRVLSSNATLDYYNIVNGVTIYYLKKRGINKINYRV